MDEMLNYPKVDPHGSPIPNQEGNVVEQQYQSLVDLAVGQKVQLSALTKSSVDLLHYLNELNIELGTHIEVLKKEPFDNSLIISCNGKAPLMVSQKVAKSLLVTKVV